MSQKSSKELKIDHSLREGLEKLAKQFNPNISEIELNGFVSESMRIIEDEVLLSRCERISGPERKHC